MILCEQPYPEILDAITAELGGGNIELIFVRGEEMRQLNAQTRGIDKATDVLSFPLDPAAFAGFGEDFSEENSAHENSGGKILNAANSASENFISERNSAAVNSLRNSKATNLDRNFAAQNSAKQNFTSNSALQNSVINSVAQSSINTDFVAVNSAAPSSSADQIRFIDGGTLASFLMPTMAEFDEILLVDCIDADGAKGGEVYYFDYDAMPKQISWSGSAHEVEMLQTLQMMDLCGDLPHVKILAVVPRRIEEASFKLSSVILESSKIMEKTALKYLSDLGFAHEKIADLSAQDIADRFAKRGRDDSSI